MDELQWPARSLRGAVAWAYGNAGALRQLPPLSDTATASERAPAGLYDPEATPIGTEALLLGALGGDRPVDRVLRYLGITRNSVMTMIRKRDSTGEWTSDDGGDPVSEDGFDRFLAALTERRLPFLRPFQLWRLTYTPAAQRALHASRAQAVQTRTLQARRRHLLVGVLHDPTNRATEVLAALGVDPVAAYEAAGAALRGRPAPESSTVDDLDVDLRFTRAVLLGQATYVSGNLALRLHSSLLSRLASNWAEMPGYWAMRDADEQARRLGQPTYGTAHLVLGILATHEVAFAHPHLLPADAPRLFRGGAVLAAHGLTHRRAKQALLSGLGTTTRRAGLAEAEVDALQAIGIDVAEIVSRSERSFGAGALAASPDGRTHPTEDFTLDPPDTRDTGSLLDALLRRPDTEARRLLVATDVDPQRVRAELATPGQARG